MNTNQPVDQSARDDALDANKSFIVQAPAGSGKTSLLTQRFLKLLTKVNHPEEVLAITFTRKAAAEMKNRLLESLQLATLEKPQQGYLQTTWQLARQVLQRDQQLEWGILQHPARLKIQTIDSLCTSINRQLPVLSGIGGNLTLLDSADEYYLLAAERAVLMVEDAEYCESLLPLVAHLDGNLPRLQRLLASMLSQRLNWAGVTGVEFNRDGLDLAWRDWIQRRIFNLEEIMQPFRQVLQPLWIFSCNQRAKFDAENSTQWLEFSQQQWPENTLLGLTAWQKIADLLLTNKNELRKTVTVKQGFPAKGSAKNTEDKALFEQNKNQLVSFLNALSDQDDCFKEELVEALAAIKLLPLPGFRDDHWRVLESLAEALKYSLAQLWMIFNQHSIIDFPEITIRAQQALGCADNPTELALRMDYQISHILLDEFQDTSQSQRTLLSLLTAGWEIDDGRSLFVVGDPMQSIYRFRAAEVSIFLEAWHQKELAGIKLNQLSLSTNFRSEKAIVDWVNDAFDMIFPTNDDEQLGAVKYSKSDAMDQTVRTEAINVLPIYSRDDELEANWVVEKISEIRDANAQHSCAILVRSKSHLEKIAPLLRVHAIPFEAVDIESLVLQPVIQDLFSLTAAMLDDADRLHWLAILRAPWCAISLSDLTRLVEGNNRLIPEILGEQDAWHAVSEDGKKRLKKFSGIINQWMAVKGQKDLSSWIETLWLCLQGPVATSASVNNNPLEDANSYFQLLSKHSTTGSISLQELYIAVKDLYAKPEQGQQNPVYLMSMHKSKGLEFDHVFLPGLGRRTKSGEQPLLEWMQWPKPEGDVDLLLAPIKGIDEDDNAFYKVLQDINSKKSKFENQRLLYVAVTRAKRSLYFSGHIKDKDAVKPEANCLLNLLWPMLADDFKLTSESETSEFENREDSVINPLQATLARIDVEHRLIETKNNYMDLDNHLETETTEIKFEWATERARVVGLVAHKLFQWLPTLDSLPDAEQVTNLKPWFVSQLQCYGLDINQTNLATKKLHQLTCNILNSEKGKWILDNKHRDGKCEWALGVYEPKQQQSSRLIVDRSFIDETGTRWIIDFKTGSHEGANRQHFLSSEKKRYQPQLEKYAKAVAQLESNPIRLGIYFPAMDEWLEWSLSKTVDNK